MVYTYKVNEVKADFFSTIKVEDTFFVVKEKKMIFLANSAITSRTSFVFWHSNNPNLPN